ncbi:MAG TPA: hypothetical protein VNH41_09170, partial [Steroidobacteraceae bacterium]|nr:hypothetical protein [Steroidobacteraceae bacterium]
DADSAHSARYDAERSADIFCLVCNRLRDSHRGAEERARALGWLSDAADTATDTAADDAALDAELP